MVDKIKLVQGQEPQREGEYPHILLLGQGVGTTGIKAVTIQVEVENCGTYGIVWFVAYGDKGNMLARMNALHTLFVEYDVEQVVG